MADTLNNFYQIKKPEGCLVYFEFKSEYRPIKTGLKAVGRPRKQMFNLNKY